MGMGHSIVGHRVARGTVYDGAMLGYDVSFPVGRRVAPGGSLGEISRNGFLSDIVLPGVGSL